MRQFDVYANVDKDTRQAYPYFVDIQTELLQSLNSRVVIPLINVHPGKDLPENLCPKVDVAGRQYYLLAYQLTTVPSSFLAEREGSLLLSRTEILNALDFLVSGI